MYYFLFSIILELFSLTLYIRALSRMLSHTQVLPRIASPPRQGVERKGGIFSNQEVVDSLVVNFQETTCNQKRFKKVKDLLMKNRYYTFSAPLLPWLIMASL